MPPSARTAMTILAVSFLGAAQWPVGVPASAVRAENAAKTNVAATIQVSHDRYPAHAEPSVAVNPRNPRNLLGSAMFVAPHTVRVGTFVSFDGGRSWHDNGPLPVPAGMDYTGDTTAAFDDQGTGFVSAVIAKISDEGTHVARRTGVYLWRTDDGGRSFHGPTSVVTGQAIDHPSLAVGPGTNDLYLAWRIKSPDGLAFSRSNDHGRTFSAPRIILTSGQQLASVPMVAAGPGGAVYVAYDLEGGEPRARVSVLSSMDRGRTFHRSTVDWASLTLTPSPQIHLPSPLCIATDARDGSVYIAYSSYDAASASSQILVERSRAHGLSWEAPVQVTPSGHLSGIVSFQPRVVVDDAGGIDVTYFALSRGRVNVMLARAKTGSARFGSPRVVTTHSFDPRLGVREGGKAGSWWIGDYQGLAAEGRMIYPFWNDTRTGRLEIFTALIPPGTAH